MKPRYFTFLFNNNNNNNKLRQASLRRRPTRRTPMVAHCAVQEELRKYSICTIFGVVYVQNKEESIVRN